MNQSFNFSQDCLLMTLFIFFLHKSCVPTQITENEHVEINKYHTNVAYIASATIELYQRCWFKASKKSLV